jgi:L-serine kinase (ADP)
MKKVILVSIANLKPHEHVIPEKLKKVKDNIKNNGVIINPIVIDQKHQVILDGHHRVQALKLLGYTKVPAYVVDYFDENITVDQRRKEIPISKKIIIKGALSGEIFPCKTSKHKVPDRPMGLNVALDDLR